MEITVEDVATPTTPSPQAAARTDGVAHLALASRFEITDANQAEDNKLAEVWAYAQGMAKSPEISDVMWEVIHLEGVLGAPRLGESRLDRLYRYTKLKRQEAKIQEDLKNVSGSVNIH